MHIEIRKIGKKKKYYLSHSFRDNGKVRKVRRFLGVNLSKEEINRLRKNAEQAIREQIESFKKIRDPLNAALSPKELDLIKTLVAKGDIKIKLLSGAEWKTFIESFTYNTNAIEGSMITFTEAKDIINNNKWPKDKSKEDISETYGVADAIDYIRKNKEHISLELIKKLHEICFKNSKHFAGNLRGSGIEVVVADSYGNVLHRGAPQKQVVSLLKELVEWYNSNKNRYHPVVLAAVVHNQFENIHPFQDGNGRVGRLLLNNILLKHNLPPVDIELKNRGEYYSSLRSYQHKGDLRPTIELILKEYRELKKKLKSM